MLKVTASKSWHRYFALIIVGGSLAGVTALAQQELKAPAVLTPNLGAKQIPLPAAPRPVPVQFAPTQPTQLQQVPSGLRSARKEPHLPGTFQPVPVTTPNLSPQLTTSPSPPVKTYLGKQPATAAPSKPAPAQPMQPTITEQDTPPVAFPPAQPHKLQSSAVSAAMRAAPLTPELVRLRQKINDTLAIYARRQQNTRDNTAWEVMHAFVAYNVRTEIRRDGPNGPPVNAIGWILWGQRCNGQPLLTLVNDRPRVEIGVGVQGHPGQLLAILAQSRVSIDTPVKIHGRDFTLRNLLEEEKLGCRPNTELTFRLIALSHYLDLDETWIASDGQEWSIPRLIQEELKAPVRGAACGGTHRLYGLTYAYYQRLKRGQPLDGEYARAKAYIENYQKYAWSLMNPDGTFSTSWFNKAENKSDVDRKIQTTGHVMEWLILCQTDAELRSPRMMRAMDYLATNLKNDPRHDWKLGPLGHAIHTLVLYNERVFNAVKVPPELVAKREKPPATLPQPLPETTSPQTMPLPMAAPLAPSLSPPIKTPLPNPFDDDLEVQVPVPAHGPALGPTLPNLAPPKNQRDQGQEDEQSSQAIPDRVQPAIAIEAVDPQSVQPPVVEPVVLIIRDIKPENKEPIKLP